MSPLNESFRLGVKIKDWVQYTGAELMYFNLSTENAGSVAIMTFFKDDNVPEIKTVRKYILALKFNELKNNFITNLIFL